MVFTARFDAQLANIIDYSRTAFGETTAIKTGQVIQRHITRLLAVFPDVGRRRGDIDCSQSWVPGTPFVVLYDLDNDGATLAVLAIYHHAKDPASFAPHDAQ